MEHTPIRVSVCSQKGGVGKSSLTVLVASWLHYVMKRNVLVVDCDFPQWSIHTQRERELHVLEHSDYFKLMLLRQFRSSQRKLWPVVKTTPPKRSMTPSGSWRRNDTPPSWFSSICREQSEPKESFRWLATWTTFSFR